MEFGWPRKSGTVAPAKWGLKPLRGRKQSRSYLVAIALATVALWQVPLGSQLLYPFSLLATWFHEMGHGLASMVLGARFEELVIYADSSGYAKSSWPSDAPRLFHAITAAAGLLGPAAAGAALILSSRTERATRRGLYILAGALILSTIIWVRSLAGWAVLPALGALTLLLAIRGSRKLQRFGIELLGVQAAVSIWRDVDYLFSPGAVVGGASQMSDTAAIADVLILPYWFWGGAITLTIVCLLWTALRVASKP